MAADLSKLSDEDLLALKSGDLSKVSDEGLLHLKRGSLSGPSETPLPSAAERVANDPITKGAQEVLQTTPAELIAANPATRFALGAASPVLGAAQLLAESLGNKDLTEYLKNLHGIEQRGQAAISDPQQRGFPSLSGGSLPPQTVDTANDPGDVAEIAGNFLGFAPASKLPSATSALGKIAQGAMVGGVAGATAPVTSDNYWGSKGGQVLLGTLVGGVIPAGIEGAKAVGKGATNFLDMFTSEGAKRILTRYQRQITGEQNVPAVIAALRQAQEVPGYPSKASEMLAGVPEGSPLAMHEAITSKTPGGVSARFGQRIIDQETAINTAEKMRDKVTKPLRDAAIEAANKGGVTPDKITVRIDQILADPEHGTNPVASKALTAVKEKIGEWTNTNGVIDASALYEIRKNLGVTIGQFSKENAKWNQKMTARLERQIQSGIDDAIEGAIRDSGSSGNLWKRYLNEYATRSENIKHILEKQDIAYKPSQRTDLAGGADVAGQMRVHGPQLLSRPMMMANWVLRKMGENVETKIDPEAATRYLDPQKLANELEKFTPAARKGIVQDLIGRGRLPVIGGIASEAAQSINPPPQGPRYQPGMTGARG